MSYTSSFSSSSTKRLQTKTAFGDELSKKLTSIRTTMEEQEVSTEQSSRTVQQYKTTTISHTEDMEVDDILVATKDYTAESSECISLRLGDLVEVIHSDSSAKRARLDPDLDVGASDNLLDSSAAKHKLAVRPKRNHSNSRQKESSSTVATTAEVQEERLFVRLFDGSDEPQEGWVPAQVLVTQSERVLFGGKSGDAKYRREAVVRELVETEEEFGKDLQNVVERYMKPLEGAAAPRLVRDNKDLLFGNLKQIADFHNTLVYYYSYFSNRELYEH